MENNKKLLLLPQDVKNLSIFHIQCKKDCNIILTEQFTTKPEIDTWITANKTTLEKLEPSSTLGLHKVHNKDKELALYFSKQITTLYPNIISVDFLGNSRFLTKKDTKDTTKSSLETFKSALMEDLNIVSTESTTTESTTKEQLPSYIRTKLEEEDTPSKELNENKLNENKLNENKLELLYLEQPLRKILGYQTLTFPKDKLNCRNLLLIDRSDLKYSTQQIFYNAANESTLPVLFSHSTLREELKQLIDSHTSLERITIATHNGTMNNKLFLNNETYFTSSDLLPNQTNFSKNVSFFTSEV